MIIKNPNQEKINRLNQMMLNERSNLITNRNEDMFQRSGMSIDELIQMLNNVNLQGALGNPAPRGPRSNNPEAVERDRIAYQNYLATKDAMSQGGGFDLPVLSALLSLFGLGSKKKESNVGDVLNMPKEYLDY
tara:strand:- start:41236 stop:41634 length:399 start_codon:yes stop_codon:yes gene_type:complete